VIRARTCHKDNCVYNGRCTKADVRPPLGFLVFLYGITRCKPKVIDMPQVQTHYFLWKIRQNSFSVCRGVDRSFPNATYIARGLWERALLTQDTGTRRRSNKAHRKYCMFWIFLSAFATTPSTRKSEGPVAMKENCSPFGRAGLGIGASMSGAAQTHEVTGTSPAALP
jgi:hypothetical protein